MKLTWTFAVLVIGLSRLGYASTVTTDCLTLESTKHFNYADISRCLTSVERKICVLYDNFQELYEEAISEKYGAELSFLSGFRLKVLKFVQQIRVGLKNESERAELYALTREKLSEYDFQQYSKFWKTLPYLDDNSPTSKDVLKQYTDIVETYLMYKSEWERAL